MLIKILNSNKILSIHDAPKEDDAFRYAYGYPEYIKTILNKDAKINGSTTTSTRKTVSICN